MTTTALLLADRYRLCAQIGRGGLGVVWEAHDELLQREVAVKELSFPPGLSDEERERLAANTLREAQAVAAIDIAAAVRVFDVVEQDGRPWVVMEMVRGRSLTEILGEHELLPGAEVARIGLFVLDALEAAHRVGVLHRDVKPSNVIVTDEGRVALSDFGIATVDNDPDDGTGVMVGSPLYLAPELAAGEEATPAADFYSLGATLWTAVQGAPPVLSDDPPFCERCTPELADLLSRLLSRQAADRPGPAEIRSTLEAVCRDARAAAVRPLPGAGTFLPESFDRSRVLEQRPAQDSRTWPLLLAFAATLVVAAVVLSQLLGGGSGGGPRAGAKEKSSGGTTTGGLPAGWHRYNDPAGGWSIGLPAGWTLTSTSGAPRFDDPHGGRYVQVLPAFAGTGDAMSVERSQEASFAAAHSDYALLGMQPVDLTGARSAADWEFTYVDQGAALHAVDRVIIAHGHGYAVFVQTHSDLWQSARQLREDLLASFRPA